jgi:hypothetical protein
MSEGKPAAGGGMSQGAIVALIALLFFGNALNYVDRQMPTSALRFSSLPPRR